jgi:hypothetical protein
MAADDPAVHVRIDSVTGMRKEESRLAQAGTARLLQRSGLPIELTVVKLRQPVKTFAVAAIFNRQNRRVFFENAGVWWVFGDGVGDEHQIGALPLAGLGQLAAAILVGYVDLFRALILPATEMEQMVVAISGAMDESERLEIEQWMVKALAGLRWIAEEFSGDVGEFATALYEQQMALVHLAEHQEEPLRTETENAPLTDWASWKADPDPLASPTVRCYFQDSAAGLSFFATVTVTDHALPQNVSGPVDGDGVEHVGAWALAEMTDGSQAYTYFRRPEVAG